MDSASLLLSCLFIAVRFAAIGAMLLARFAGECMAAVLAHQNARGISFGFHARALKRSAASLGIEVNPHTEPSISSTHGT